MKILVTSFEPFGGNKLNSSWEVASLLPDRIGGSVVVKGLLPVDFMIAGDVLNSLIDHHSPDVIVSLGQSGKYAGLSVERVALNLMDCVKADNGGYVPVNEKIHADGDTAYMTDFPIRSMVESCNRKGLAARVSNSAGTYVCNRVYYEALYAIAKRNLPLRALFIHLPYVLEQDKNPSVAKEQLADGVEGIIKMIDGEKS